jgi:hypothetical protein
MPISLTSTSITSPGFMNTFGLRVVLDPLRHAEHEVVRIGRLHHAPVQPRLDLHLAGIGQLILGALL